MHGTFAVRIDLTNGGIGGITERASGALDIRLDFAWHEPGIGDQWTGGKRSRTVR